ncbi:AraC-type DNA-binding protein [Faunimonas pinastri]|uniref:AraC-type DNA-binding protein n=1 Tax=Faunimonas pinastri TaxID=1855383 RepID=A0A1H9IJC4_9HYPH|nr:AraC family transcriptional regulator [Faunimonas pinastri]SEQ74703.1 AraC-type DNA-binding protein [Faunimonas pinastri]
MKPDLEVVQLSPGESFKAWSHGYPFRTVRWHFHPEYEIHLVVETSGRYFVGDFIGDFEPGNLLMTGPNLPHNWVSNVPEGTTIERRGLILQFPEAFIQTCMAAFPELACFEGMLERSRRGLLFSPATAEIVKPWLAELIDAQGPRRIALFMGILDALLHGPRPATLVGCGYQPDPSAYLSAPINRVLDHLSRHLTERESMADLAGIAGQSPSAFCRSFRRHTGMTPVQYVNRLRINLACQLLMSEPDQAVTDICFDVGFNNLSNFNHQFLVLKGMPPSRFRALHAAQAPQQSAA